MNLLYNLAMLLLVVGVPAAIITIILAVIKPGIVRNTLGRDFSRLRITGVGSAALIFGTLGLITTAGVTQPESVKAEIAAKNKVEQAMKAKKLEAEKLEKKVLAEKQAQENKPVVKTVTAKTVVPFIISEKEDATLAKGKRVTSTKGAKGEKTKTYEVTYIKGKQTAKKLVKDEVTTQPVNEIVSVGTYVAPPIVKAAPKPAAPAPTPASAPAPAVAPSQSGSDYYANCSAARAAGAAPIYEGQPGYRAGLDRDHDGVACE